MSDTLDESKARLLQDMYFILRDRIELGNTDSTSCGIVLQLLEEEVKVFAEILASIQARKTNYKLTNKNSIAERTANRFIEMYLKNREWKCGSFRNRVYLEVLYIMYGADTKKSELHNKTVDVDVSELQLANPEQDKVEDDRTVIEDIRALMDGDRIIIACARSRSYKDFILTIETFIPKRVIYDFAKRLRILYKNTRRR